MKVIGTGIGVEAVVEQLGKVVRKDRLCSTAISSSMEN
jgi:ribose 5-phosphate isomerase